MITVAAFQTAGSVILKMTVEMAQMKETFVRKKLVRITNSPVRGRGIVFRRIGCAMEMMTALTNKMSKIVLQLHVCQLSLNVLICDNVCKKVTSAMEFLIVMTGAMNWDAVSYFSLFGLVIR